MQGDATVVVELDQIERGAALSALADKRNQLIKEGRPTDAVNEAIVKIAGARARRRGGRDEGR